MSFNTRELHVMKNLYLLISFIAVLFIASCGKPANNKEENTSDSKVATELEEVQLLLPTHGTAMYFTYVAQHNHYFEEEGLDVELLSGVSGRFVVEQISIEQVDIGIVAVPSLFTAWNEDIDIQVVYQINSTNLFDLIVPRASDITTVIQLKGKTIGVTDFGAAEVPMVKAILASAQISADHEITFREYGNDGTTILSAFETGEIAAFSGGAHDLISLYSTGFRSKSLLPKIYRTLPSTAIIANGKVIKERPELVEKISRAVAKAVDFSIKNRKETFDIMKNAVPEEYLDKNNGRLFLDTFINLSTPIESDKGYGFIYRDSWEKLVEQYSVGTEPVITKQINLDNFLNSSFIKSINEFEK